MALGAFNYARLLPLTAKLNISVVPRGAQVMLDGKRTNSGIVRVRPGKHTVTAYKPGFDTHPLSVMVADRQEKFAGLILLSNSSTTSSWYTDHPADQQLAESISGQNTDKISRDIISSTPIIKNLPFIDERSNFRIDYGQSQQYPDDPTAVALYITTDDRQETKDVALAWIRFSGYDPTKLEIIYKTF